MEGNNSSEEKASGPPHVLENQRKRSSLAEGEAESLAILGYKPELQRNRSMFTLLFQSLAIAAIPYGEGAPLLSAIYGSGQLSKSQG